MIDAHAHPELSSVFPTTWDRETKIKAQGLVVSIKFFQFIITFLIVKNSLETIKPIAAKLQKKDQDVLKAYMMIDETINAVERMRSNVEEECHEWFTDASRIAENIGSAIATQRITGRQRHRSNAASDDPESHYRRIPFLDHLLQEMSKRFSTGNRAGSQLFALVPPVMVQQDNLRELAEKLKFWESDLPTPSSLISELKEWQYFWQQQETSSLPANLVECFVAADEDQGST